MQSAPRSRRLGGALRGMAAHQRLDDRPHARPGRRLDHHGVPAANRRDHLRLEVGRGIP